MSSAKGSNSNSSRGIDRAVEGLYCACHNGNADYARLRDNLTLSRFANAIGGTLHLPKQDALLMEKITEEHSDFLPGGRYELGYSHLAKSHLESQLGVLLNLITNADGMQFANSDFSPRGDKYFICKSCCPVCRSASRGCTLHCCRTCWIHLRKLDVISYGDIGLPPLAPRTKKLKKDQLERFIESVTNDPNIPNGKLLRPNTGYFHNDMDIVFYLYSTYDLPAEYCKSLIHALAAM